MKQIFVFLTLIGLIFVNQKLNAQVEYYNETNPRPEEVQLLPTMKNAHNGTNFSVEEVKNAHLTGLNSYVPIDVQNTFTQEKVRTMFAYYQPEVKEIDAWIAQNTILGSNPSNWSNVTFSYLVPGPAPSTVFLSGGYQSKNASGSNIGPKMIERKPYKKGDRGYTEDEQFLYLDLGKICPLSEYQEIQILWISLGCGNHVFPLTPPTLNRQQEVIQTPIENPQRNWGSDWVVSVSVVYQQPQVVQFPPQSFNYCDMSYKWGYGYNPCWWSPAVYYPTNCWGCNSYFPQQQPVTNNYYYEGDTYITNEGDQVINEGDVIVINNPPAAEDPDENPDDDGGPVNPYDPDLPDGDNDPDTNDGGPVNPYDPNVGLGTGNGNNNQNPVNPNGMIVQGKESLVDQSEKVTTTSFSDLVGKTEAEYWSASQSSISAMREQNQSKPTNWVSSTPTAAQTTSQSGTKQPVQTTTTTGRGNGNTSNQSATTSPSNTYVSRGNANQSKPTNWVSSTPTAAQTTSQSGTKQPVQTTTTTGRGNGNTSNQSATTSPSNTYVSRGNANQSKPTNWVSSTPTAAQTTSQSGTKQPVQTTTTTGRGNGNTSNQSATTSPSNTYVSRGNGSNTSQNTTVQKGSGGQKQASGGKVISNQTNTSSGRFVGGNSGGGMRSSGAGMRAGGGRR